MKLEACRSCVEDDGGADGEEGWLWMVGSVLSIGLAIIYFRNEHKRKDYAVSIVRNGYGKMRVASLGKEVRWRGVSSVLAKGEYEVTRHHRPFASP